MLLEPPAIESPASPPVAIDAPRAVVVASRVTQPPTTFWQRLAKDSARVGLAALVTQATGVVTSLALRAMLSPAEIGLWQALRLCLGYANYANLGVSKAIARQASITLRDPTRRRSFARNLSAARHFNDLTILAFGGCLLLLALVRAARSEWGIANAWRHDPWVWGFAAIALLAWLQRKVTFEISLLRAGQQFARTTRISMVEALVGGMLSLLAAAWLGVPGLLVAAGAISLLVWSLVKPVEARTVRHREPRRSTWRRGGRLAVEGLPLVLSGLLSTLLVSLDKLLVLAWSPEGTAALGCYSLSLLVGGQLNALAALLNLTSQPRFGEVWGRHRDRDAVFLIARRVALWQGMWLSLWGVLAIALAAPLLTKIYPAYSSGLSPLIWVVATAVLAGMTAPLGQALVAIEGGRSVIVVLLTTIGLAAAAATATWQAGFGLNGIAASLTAAHGCQWLILMSLSFPPSCRMRVITSVVELLLVPVTALAVTWWLTSERTLGKCLLAAAGGLLAWGMTVALMWRRDKTRRHAEEVVTCLD